MNVRLVIEIAMKIVESSEMRIQREKTLWIKTPSSFEISRIPSYLHVV
jgi:hypothetical protein